jgi:F-box-like
MSAAINRLPNELLLRIFCYLTLKSLIASYGVCQLWRQLIPSSDILPNRHALFLLYLEVVSSPYFARSRPWTLKKLKPLDRDAYVNTLLEQHNYLPEAFHLWVLEWPARAVFGCLWPGLPSIHTDYEVGDGIERLEGCNWLCSGQVSALTARDDTSTAPDERIPGLLVRSSCNGYTWLMLDEREWLRDKVFQVEDTIIWKEVDEEDIIHENWIEFQKAMWRRIEKAAASEGERTRARPASGLLSGTTGPYRIPGRPWVRGQRSATKRDGFHDREE